MTFIFPLPLFLPFSAKDYQWRAATLAQISRKFAIHKQPTGRLIVGENNRARCYLVKSSAGKIIKSSSSSTTSSSSQYTYFHNRYIIHGLMRSGVQNYSVDQQFLRPWYSGSHASRHVSRPRNYVRIRSSVTQINDTLKLCFPRVYAFNGNRMEDNMIVAH